jgi:hypothetical protein
MNMHDYYYEKIKAGVVYNCKICNAKITLSDLFAYVQKGICSYCVKKGRKK